VVYTVIYNKTILYDVWISFVDYGYQKMRWHTATPQKGHQVDYIWHQILDFTGSTGKLMSQLNLRSFTQKYHLNVILKIYLTTKT